MYGSLDVREKKSRNSEEGRKKCTKLWRTEGKMHRILEDVRKNARKLRRQKKNPRKSRREKGNAPNSRGRKEK
jgi:hypothetical protein